MAFHPDFSGLCPVSADYARLPVADAFTWPDCALLRSAGEWYMVAFRSIRKPGVDEELLWALDDDAHREAAASPGYVHYLKGPANERGECLSFCLWESRALARAAAGGPAHVLAAAVAGESYASYTIEFHRVRKLRGARRFEFEPYDRPLALAV